MLTNSQLIKYQKTLLTKTPVNGQLLDYIESCLANEVGAVNHSFHKIMIYNWCGTDVLLFESMMDYFKCPFIPVLYVPQPDITVFYTSSLSLVLKIIKQDLTFKSQKNVYNISIVFNDKKSIDCFESFVTLEEVVTGVVSRRLKNNELDLSNFSSDPEFLVKNINFYKINLLSQFKIFMLRIGKHIRSLDLSYNNLSRVPMGILNFLIKGELTSINLSNNDIPSLSEVLRISSKIEKLWIEGNPLCDDMEPHEYVKNITVKFPRLIELDGVKLNNYGIMMPQFKNFLVTPDLRTKFTVDNFLKLYFSYYDFNRLMVEQMYDEKCTFSMSNNFTESEKLDLSVYVSHSRNALNANIRMTDFKNKLYDKNGLLTVLKRLPSTTHDPSTFSVDVLIHNAHTLVIVLDGIFRETVNPANILQFRRTFVFNIVTTKPNSLYTIKNEMFTVGVARKELVERSFQGPVINMNELALIDPEPQVYEAIIKMFTHVTLLKRQQAKTRLKLYNWDIRKAIEMFLQEMNNANISADMFSDDDFSDSSSIVNCDID